jgi:plasmid stabilization system protein ParE
LSRYLLTVDAERDIDLIKDYLLLRGGTSLAHNLPGYIQ